MFQKNLKNVRPPDKRDLIIITIRTYNYYTDENDSKYIFVIYN